ncbi:MAG: hypothetical protein ACFFD4_06560 [Candidatus Odinarchaeota archaeon]
MMFVTPTEEITETELGTDGKDLLASRESDIETTILECVDR